MLRFSMLACIVGLVVAGPALMVDSAMGILVHAQETDSAFTSIPQIQGRGMASPLQGETVSVVGSVTGVAPSGFYLQDPVGDGDPLTSDGLFVYTHGAPGVAAGDCVAVRGAIVEEFYAKTELNRAQAVELVQDCSASVTPVLLRWPRLGTPAAEMLEPLEGMLVRLVDSAGAGPVGIVQGPTRYFAGGEAELALLGKQQQRALGPIHLLRDVQVNQVPASQALLHFSNRLGAELLEASWGELVYRDLVYEDEANGDETDGNDVNKDEAGLVGVIDYNFGKYQLLLRPGQRLTHTAQPALFPPAEAQVLSPPAPPDAYTLCALNLHGLGRGTAQYPESDAYAAALAQRAATIAGPLQGCTVVALQETGSAQDAENLATTLAADFGLNYTSVALGGPAGRSPEFPLTNSVIMRSERVQVLAQQSIQGCTARDFGMTDSGACAPGSYSVFDRPPLAVKLKITPPLTATVVSPTQTLWVISNHWKSKAGDETENVPLRAAQAQAVADFVQERRTANPSVRIAVMGDLNDFYQGPAVAKLVGGADTDLQPGLVNTLDFVPRLQRYTYIFDGTAQVLDHILLSPDLLPQLAAVKIVHVHADRSERAAGDGERSSDHDPILVRLHPRGAAALGGNLRFGGIRVRALTTDGTMLAAGVTDSDGEFRLWGLPIRPLLLQLLAPPDVYWMPSMASGAAIDDRIDDGADTRIASSRTTRLADGRMAVTLDLGLSPGYETLDAPATRHATAIAAAWLSHRTPYWAAQATAMP